MKSTLIAHVKVVVCVSVSLVLGQVLHDLIGGLPGSLYGLLIFALLLAVKLVDADQIGPVVETYISYMPIVFVPVCVGIIEFGPLFASEGWKMILLGVAAVLLVLSLASMLSQWLLRNDHHD
jgi:holin-like protein